MKSVSYSTERGRTMPDMEENRAVSVGYSLPRWMHKRITVVADERGMSASQLVLQAVRFYFRANEIELKPADAPETKAS